MGLCFTYECLYYAEDVYFCKKFLYFYNCTNEHSITHVYYDGLFQDYAGWAHYVRERMGQYDKSVDDQITARYCDAVIAAVLQEMRFDSPIRKATIHVRNALKKSDFYRSDVVHRMPRRIRIFLLILRLHLYHLALLAARYNRWMRRRREVQHRKPSGTAIATVETRSTWWLAV